MKIHVASVVFVVLISISFLGFLLFFAKEPTFNLLRNKFKDKAKANGKEMNLQILGATRPVKTKSGYIEGIKKSVFGIKINEFRGIPYAMPPIGSLRFKRPIAIHPWRGVLKAKKFGASCAQNKIRHRKGQLFMPGLPDEHEPLSEDCLFLNIWTPVNSDQINDNIKKPVMFFVYGGAYFVGTASSDDYDGSILSAIGDVVVVTFNYRVGSLGYFATYTSAAPGNQGMYDQALALEWVKENIDRFGGDPDLITLFGHSAGGISVGLMLFAPRTKDLFKRAILESGGTAMGNLIFTENGLEENEKLAELTGCVNSYDTDEENLNNTSDEDYNSFISKSNEVVECLQNVEVDEILKAEREIVIKENRFVAFLPRVLENDSMLANNPNDLVRYENNLGKHVNEILMGTVEDEGGMFLNAIMPYLFGHDAPVNMTHKEAEMFIDTALTWVPQPGTRIVKSVLYNDSVPQKQLLRHIINVVGSVTLLCPVVLFGEQFGAFQPKRKGYFYHFTYRSKRNNFWPDWFGVGHSSELSYIFGKPLKYREQFDDIDRDLSNDLIRIWTTFAKTGSPPLPSNVLGKQWPLYSAAHPNHVIINPSKGRISHDPPKDGICNKWRFSVEL